MLIAHRRLPRLNSWKLRILVGLVSMLILIGILDVASLFAHPLGNFTINRYSRIEFSTDQGTVYYVLDMAEIPAWQEIRELDSDRDGYVSDSEADQYAEMKREQLRRGLHLSVGGREVRLRAVSHQLSFPPGQADLKTLRLSVVFNAMLPASSAGKEREFYFRDDNFGKRIGWKEIVVRAARDVSILRSTAPEHDLSDELRQYPKDALKSPPNIRDARGAFAASGVGAPDSPRLASVTVEPSGNSDDFLTSMISVEELTLPVILLALMAAMGLGALHAASPGHGKAIMAAYLVGTRGTARHAIFLGFTVTLSHILGVVLLGAVAIYASHLIAPEHLYPWLGLVSGALILAVGGRLLLTRLRGGRGGTAFEHHRHTEPRRAVESGRPRTRSDLAGFLKGASEAAGSLAHAHTQPHSCDPRGWVVSRRQTPSDLDQPHGPGRCRGNDPIDVGHHRSTRGCVTPPRRPRPPDDRGFQFGDGRSVGWRRTGPGVRKGPDRPHRVRRPAGRRPLPSPPNCDGSGDRALGSRRHRPICPSSRTALTLATPHALRPDRGCDSPAAARAFPTPGRFR